MKKLVLFLCVFSIVAFFAQNAHADWKVVRGQVTYNSPYEFGKYDRIEVYDGGANLLGWTYIGQAPPHNYQVNFWWEGGSTQLKIIAYYTHPPTSTCTRYKDWDGSSSPVYQDFSWPCEVP